MKYTSIFLKLSLFFSSCAALSMELLEVADMVKINTFQDVEPFKGKLVAYVTNYDFYLSEQGYSYDNEKIKFGYVTDHLGDWAPCDGTGWHLYPNEPKRDRERGYELIQLVVDNSFSYKPLVNFRLKEADLKMRLITVDELISIHWYIKRKDVAFEALNGNCLFKERALHYMQNEMKRLNLPEGKKYKVA